MGNNKILFVMLALVLGTLACGSGSSIEVNQPISQEDAVNTQVALMFEENESSTDASVSEAQPTSAPLGSARSNPAPKGSEVVADQMAFVVSSTIRPATDIIMAGNQFNTRPGTGQEYVLVAVTIECRKSSDEKCSLFSSNFKLLGSSGISHDPEIIVSGVDGLLDWNSEFYGGASVSGQIPFIAGSEETNLLLVYEPFLGDEFFLSIE